jgi:hypothetical protein
MQVTARTIAVQFEGFNLGNLTALHQVVVDKAGKFTYPLQMLGGTALPSRAGFTNALMVDVYSCQRTKKICMHTPYCLANKTQLAMRFKVCMIVLLVWATYTGQCEQLSKRYVSSTCMLCRCKFIRAPLQQERVGLIRYLCYLCVQREALRTLTVMMCATCPCLRWSKQRRACPSMSLKGSMT